MGFRAGQHLRGCVIAAGSGTPRGERGEVVRAGFHGQLHRGSIPARTGCGARSVRLWGTCGGLRRPEGESRKYKAILSDGPMSTVCHGSSAPPFVSRVPDCARRALGHVPEHLVIEPETRVRWLPKFEGNPGCVGILASMQPVTIPASSSAARASRRQRA